jgi:hypothetical protein
MLFSHRIRSRIALVLVGLLSIPLTSLAADPGGVTRTSLEPVDVTLSPGGMLRGYVVDGQGVAATGVAVRLVSPDGQQVDTRSDSQGRFGYQGLAGGSYQLQTEYGEVVCRAWTPTAAPPRSSGSLLVVHDEQLARGQWGPPPAANSFVGQMKETMTHPFMVAAIIGAAVAIPVAIHNANKDDSGS